MRNTKKLDFRSARLHLPRLAGVVAEGIAGIAAAAFLFYGDVRAGLFLLPLLPLWVRFRTGKILLCAKRGIRNDFRELLGVLQISLRTGYSPENAFRDASRSLQDTLQDSALTEEVRRIAEGLADNLPLDVLLRDLADRCDIPEIRQFSIVFSEAKRTGGDLPGIVQAAAGQIGARIDAEGEIETAIAAKQTEHRIMCLMPPGILLYMRLTSPGYLDVLYGNVFGAAVMTVALALYAAAFLLGERITAIRV